MPAFYVPNQSAVNPIKAPAQDASQITQDASSTIQQNQQLAAAAAFQDHLNKGYQGMVEIQKQLPPQIAASVPDPGAYSDSEDKRVAWYSMVNDAVAKNSLLDQAQQPNANPDALSTAAARAPLSLDSQKLVGGEINRLDQNQQKSAIQKAVGMFDQPQAAPTPKIDTPPIDTKSNFGRTLKIALTRMEPHADTIQNAAQTAGIPPQLIMAVAAQESAGTGDSTSKTGVKGTMQVTQGTFKDIANRYPDLKLTDRTDPQQSYTAGAIYLGELAKQFGGDVPQTLAAYNAGPTAVKKAVAKYPDDWQNHLEEFVTAPSGMTAGDKAAEAQDYINKVGKFYTALGGQPITSAAAPNKTPTQNEFNMALLKSNPDAVVNPIAKEIKSGLKTDAALAATDAANASKEQDAQARLNMAKARLKNTMDYQSYQKVDKYGTAIKDIAPAALAIKRIDNVVGGLDKKGDIPGVGVGSNAFRSFLMTSATPEARDVRLALADLFPQISHAQFGSRLTSTEVNLLGQQLGTTWLSDADTFRKAIQQQREDVWQKMNDKWAALPDDAKKELYDQGVANPDMFGDFKSNIVTPKPGAAGAKKLSPAAQAAFEKIKAQRAAQKG